jgi:AcrR family transcriptional regulator
LWNTDPMDARKIRSRDRVMGAARELLLESGREGTTIDGIAARSGVAKTTIYRQWPSRGALLLDLLTEATSSAAPPDTGSAAGDVAAFARGMAAELSEPFRAAAMAAVIGGPPSDTEDELAELRRRVADERQGHARRIVRRAMTRGELPARTDAAELVRLVAGPILYRRFAEAKAVTPAAADRIAARALTALGAGPADS